MAFLYLGLAMTPANGNQPAPSSWAGLRGLFVSLGLKPSDKIAGFSLLLSAIALGFTYISYNYVSNADISKFRLEKPLDYCQKVAFGENMSSINSKMRDNDEYNKARNHMVKPDDTRIIGDYLNVLEYAAIFAQRDRFDNDPRWLGQRMREARQRRDELI